VRGGERRAGLQQRVLDFRGAGSDQRAVSGHGRWPLVYHHRQLVSARRERGRVGAFWNISHNVGGGIVAPIVGTAFALLGTEHWQTASYIVPAAVAVLFAVVVLILGKGSPRSEGLPALDEMLPEEKVLLTGKVEKAPENMSAWQIFCTYVLKNKNAWYVSMVDVFVYMVRFE
jgi:OPA family phosphoglycerate-like MFS transporter